MINISTPDVVAVRFAGALYGQALSNSTMTVVMNYSTNSAGGINALLNAVYANDFASMSTTAVGTLVAGNLGLTGALATAAAGYITGVLNAAAPGTQGAAIANTLNLFAQLTADPTWGAAATTWENQVNNADAYAHNAANTSNISFSNISTTPPGITFTLTTGVDALVGGAGNDTFNALVTGTFNPLDSINGGAGTNTLNVADNTVAVATANITVTNIQTANLSSASTVTADTSGWTGLTALNVNGSKGADSITAAGTTAVTVVDVAGTVVATGGSTVAVTTDAASQVAVDGTAGKTTAVTITGSGGATASYVVDANSSTAIGAAVGVQPVHAAPGTATANTIATVTLNTVGAGTTNILSDALTTLNLNTSTVAAGNVTVTAAAGTRALTVGLNGDTGARTLTDNTATTLNINSTGAKSTGLTVAAGAATTVAINATAALTLVDLQAALATGITVTGAGATTISALTGTTATSINASTDTGGVTVTPTLGTAVVFTGGAGNDTVTLGASTVATNMGAGNNTVTFTAALGTGGTVTAGAGTSDTVVLTAAGLAAINASGATDAAFLAAVTGFENLTLTTPGAATLDVTSIGPFSHAVTTGGATGLVTLNNFASGGTFTLNAAVGGGGSYVLANTAGWTGVSDSVNIVLTTATGPMVAGSVTATGAETVNITSTDTATTLTHPLNTMTLVDTTLTTVTVSGNAGLSLTAADTTITSVNASGMNTTLGTAGTGLVWTSGALAAAATITGSASGGDTINVAAATKAVTITETAGADTITLGKAGADTATVAGTSNTVNLGGGLDVVTFGAHTPAGTAFDTIKPMADAATSFATATTTSQVSIIASGLDIITGMTAGDTINLTAVTGAAGATLLVGAAVDQATNLAGVATHVELAHGTYSASAGTFSYNASGADTLVTYDGSDTAHAAVEVSVVLVGFHYASTTAAVLTAGVLTLA